MRYAPVKRGMDIVGAAIGLLVSAPILAVTAVAVRAKLGAPVVFRQPRPGRNGEVFTIYKFRTMLAVDEATNRVTNDQRVHPFGSLLRSTSLDELPSLWNVLRGDMSLVGPRPLRVSYLDRYSDAQATRHQVRPGLTGLAQVSGRNNLSWDEKLAIDTTYVRQKNLALDMKILARTIRKTIQREGVSADGQATMSEFFGPTRTERLQLQTLETRHLDTRVDWLTSPEVQAGVSLTFEPNLPDTYTWFNRISSDSSRQDWVAVDQTEQLVAMCGLTGLDSPSSAELYVYVNPHLIGRGYGRETMHLLMTQARIRGVKELHLQTKRTNRRSINLYRSLGFQEWSRDIGRTDAIAMHINL